MRDPRWRKVLATFVVAGGVQLADAGTAAAQAWLPERGEGYVSLLYTNIFVNEHYLPKERYQIGEIDSNTLLVDATYGLTDRVAVSLGLPIVVSRYRGSFPHQLGNPTRMDDGRWHTTAQDVRFNVRYKAIDGPLAVTPFIATVLPSNAYETWAHSAAGRHMRELHVGVTAGRRLAAISPNLFVQGRYAFAFGERVLGYKMNHSNADVEIGYFLSPSLRVFGLGSAQRMHDGIDVPFGGVGLTELQRQHHDQIGRDDFLNLGAGASISLTDRLDLFGSFLKQVAGRNGHEVNRAVSVGLTWSLRRQRPIELGSNTRERAVARCVCQKGL